MSLDQTEIGAATDDLTETITINDTTAPSPNIAVLPTLTGQCSVTVSGTPTASDGCGGGITINGTTSDPLIYTSQGTFTVNWSYNDGNGNISSQTQTITVDDTIDPTASNPVGITAECVAPAADISLVIDETDNCTASPVVAFVSDSGLVGSNPGVITRTYSITDAAGNSINVTQAITINDTTNPTASNPVGITAECVAPAADISLVIDEADNCTASPVVAFVSDSGLVGSNPGVITRTYSITDAAGNSINVTQAITINDTTNPTASNPVGITAECVAPAADISLVIDEADNCTASPVVAFVSDSGLVGSNPGVITRTYSITDAAGNSINVTQAITINDTTNPTASNPVGITAECVAPAADISLVIDEADNCTASPVVAFVSDSGLVGSNPGVITRTYSITDAAGNSINVTQAITINDTTNPTASNPVGITAECVAPAADISLVIDEADNCTASQ